MNTSDDALITKLRTAIEARSNLVTENPQTNAFRLVNGASDGLPGLVLERFGDVLFVQDHEERSAVSNDQIRSAINTLFDELQVTAVYLKRFLRDRAADAYTVQELHHDATPWIGMRAAEAFEIRENDLRFIVRPFDGFSVGLFLEHRNNRRFVRDHAEGKRVLNLYAYTCAFSVAAAAGGATEVTSVDISARYLDWGRQNFAANALDVEPHRFIKSDAEDFLDRARRQGRDFDLIAIDPPTFARLRRPKRTFKLDERLEALVAAAVNRLRPGGTLLFATNQRNITVKRIDAALHNADPKRRVRKFDRPSLPADFAGDLDYSKSVIAHYDK